MKEEDGLNTVQMSKQSMYFYVLWLLMAGVVVILEDILNPWTSTILYGLRMQCPTDSDVTGYTPRSILYCQ